MTWPPIQREPCGGWDPEPEIFLGGAEQHYNTAENGIPFYRNTTQVTNDRCGISECHQDTPCPDPVDPWARYDCDWAEGQLTGDDRTCGMATCNPPDPVPPNTYELTEETRDLAICRKMGFKNCYAVKAWHGRYGFYSHDPGGYGDTSCSGSGIDFEAAQLVPDGTKYLTLAASASIDTSTPDGDTGSSASRSMTVDRYSGKRTVNACTNSGDDDGASAAGLLGDIKNLPQLIGFARTTMGGVQGTRGGTPTYDGDGIGFDYVYDSDPEDASFHITFHLGSGTATLTYHEDDSAFGGAFGIIDWSVTVTPTTYHYEFSSVPSDPDSLEATTTTKSCDATLSDAYTAGQLDDDVNELLAQWTFADDITYPWRTDTDMTVGPLVTRNERGPTAPDIFPCTMTVDDEEVPWADTTEPPRPELAEGAIIGQPLGTLMGWETPYAADPYWDFRHAHWVLADETEESENWLVETWGAYAPGYIPNATQWVDNFAAKVLPIGPFVAYNTLQNPVKVTTCSRPIIEYGGCLIKGKWAEVIMPLRPTHNFARPCGADKTAHDPDAVNCDTNPDGDLRWPDSPCFCNDPSQTTDCDTPANPTNDYQWDDHWNKGEFTVDIFTYDFRAFGESYRTRMQRVAAQNYNDGCVDADPPCDPESCDLPDQLDPYHYIEVPDPAIGTGGIAGETIGSGSWALATMTRDQHCVAHQVCFPTVCIVQPALDGDYNGVWIGMPFIPPDDRYGSLWSARVNQWMTDPLWKSPGERFITELCDTDCDGIAEDDGTCMEDYDDPLSGDHICIYPMRPWEESLAAAPMGAPALPTGSAQIGCANFIANVNSDPPVGNPGNCNPPILLDLEWFDGSDPCGPHNAGYVMFIGVLRVALPPWTIRLNQEACVAASGRFAAEYKANGILV